MKEGPEIADAADLEDRYSLKLWLLLAWCRLEADKAGYLTRPIARSNGADVSWSFKLARDPLTLHQDPATVAVNLALMPGGAFFNLLVCGPNRGAATLHEFVAELIITPRTHAAAEAYLEAVTQPRVIEKAVAAIARLAPLPSPKHWSPRFQGHGG